MNVDSLNGEYPSESDSSMIFAMKHSHGHTHPVVDTDNARQLGMRLRCARESQACNPEYMADKLLLSKQQVLGLEAGEHTCFYGTKLYAQAADKYAALLQLDFLPSEQLFTAPTDEVAPVKPQQSITATTTAEIPIAPETPRENITDNTVSNPAPRWMLRLSIGAVVLVAVTIVGLTIFEQQSASPQLASLTQPLQNKASESQSAPAPEPAAPPTVTPAVPAEPEKPPLAATPSPPLAKEDALPTGSIRITFSGASWVQTVNSNGQKQERTYRDGESLVLEPAQLQALIIGNAGVVSVSSNTGEIRLSSYVSAGSQVARLIGPQIRHLAVKNGN